MENQTPELVRKPFNPSAGEILIKVFLGLAVAIFLAFLIFVIYTFFSKFFKTAIVNLNSQGISSVNPMLALIMAIIGFFGSFVWTLLVGGIYNVLFQNRYYDIWKMFSLNIIINIVIFIFALVLYFIFVGNINVLFLILIFHVLFSTYAVYTSYDIVSNPNYSPVYLLWNTIGFFVSLFVIAIIFKVINVTQNPSAVAYILIAPIVIVYVLLALIPSLWEKIYYKFYEVWNNFLYVPSLDEILVDEEELDEEINVE